MEGDHGDCGPCGHPSHQEGREKMTWKLVLAMAMMLIPFLLFLYRLKRYCDGMINSMVSWIPKGQRNNEDGGENGLL